MGFRFGLLVPLLLTPIVVSAQTTSTGPGHPPAPTELAAIDIDVRPDGRGLPAGSGSAQQGQAIYVARCASCHGPTGREGPNDILVGGQGSLATSRPLKTVGSYWPYATTLWDYINRAMPFQRPHSLTANEVYGATAYVLWLNGIVGEADVLSQDTLPKVTMPNRNGFTGDDRAREARPR
jgi:cytochrome c